MAKCDYCGTTILLGGVKDQSYRFCNATCQQTGRALIAANQVPVEVNAIAFILSFSSFQQILRSSHSPHEVASS